MCKSLSYCMLMCRSFSLRQHVFNVPDVTSRRFGMQISYTKTETMVFNVDEHLMELPSKATIGSHDLKNVRSLTYLVYTITNSEKSIQSISSPIIAAYQKWNGLKHVLTDNGFDRKPE